MRLSTSIETPVGACLQAILLLPIRLQAGSYGWEAGHRAFWIASGLLPVIDGNALLVLHPPGTGYFISIGQIEAVVSAKFKKYTRWPFAVREAGLRAPRVTLGIRQRYVGVISGIVD